MQLRTQLILAFLLVAFVSSTFIGMTIVQVDATHDTFHEHTDSGYTELTDFSAMNDHMHMAYIHALAYLSTGNTTYREQAHQQLARMNAEEDTYLASDPVHANTVIDTNNMTREAVTRVLAIDTDTVSDERIEEAIRAIEKTENEVMALYHDQVGDQLAAQRDTALTAIDTRFHRTEDFLIATSYLSFLLAAMLGIVLARRISEPLNSLSRTLDNISTGNMAVKIDDALLQRDDEIGRLAQAFDRTLISLKLAMRRSGSFRATGEHKKNQRKHSS